MIPRLDDVARLRLQISRLTAVDVDLRSSALRRYPSWAQTVNQARALRRRARYLPAVPVEWFDAERRVHWAATRVRFRLGDPIPGYAAGTALTFPEGEGPLQHSNVDDVRLILDYLQEIQR